jgi:hypothetical protein
LDTGLRETLFQNYPTVSAYDQGEWHPQGYQVSRNGKYIFNEDKIYTKYTFLQLAEREEIRSNDDFTIDGIRDVAW